MDHRDHGHGHDHDHPQTISEPAKDVIFLGLDPNVDEEMVSRTGMVLHGSLTCPLVTLPRC
jgi:hypothetical protein